ncbi:MAG: hypothetical protein PF447_14165 [Spirochaetaceae bacterium]|jgi:hypothetical protein|nr:hypothetical protein [Spirochaetaceae bacterium]
MPPLKHVFKEMGFFPFYFKQRKKIKKWNQDKYLIVFSFLGTKIAPSYYFKEKLDNLFLKHLLKLSPFIDVILDNGWQMKYISIWEYNVVVTFKNFYDKFYHVVKQNEIIKDDFLKLERAYVKITYHDYYIDGLLGIFEKLLKANNRNYEKNREKFDDMLEKLKMFFKPYSLPLSFREIILTYNMVINRCFYSWEDLFLHKEDEIIQGKCYECSKKVLQSLLNYCQNLNKTIEGIEQEKEHLLQLSHNSNRESDEPRILVEFYEKLEHSWNVDRENYQLLFLLTIQGLLYSLHEFIFKDWLLIKENESQVNLQLIQDKELPNLYQKLSKDFENAYNYYSVDTSTAIPLMKFRHHRNPESLNKTENQRKLYACFSVILEDLFNISLMFQAYGEIAKKSEYSQYGYIKYMVYKPEQWMGKPVFSIFNYYIELCWTICSLFRYKTFNFLDTRLVQINNELGEMLEEKQRIDEFNIIEEALSGNPFK